MGGRGSATGVDLSYQGNNGGSGRASSSGVHVTEMKDRLDSLPVKVVGDPMAEETVKQIKSIKELSDSVNIYRATVGDSINQGDWIFLSRAQAQRWTRTVMGTPKPGVEVIQSSVPASQVDWTGKNLEFIYTGKKRRKR